LSYALFYNIIRWIHDSRVDIPWLRKIEKIGTVLSISEAIRRCLIDWNRDRVSGWVIFKAGMNC
jgi:hypothetical protein